MQPVSPLYVPVFWEGDHFRILDETLLPWRTEYIEVRKVGQAIEAVREMRTRAFGQVLAFFYAAVVVVRGNRETGAEALRRQIAQLAEEFTTARPTFGFKALAQLFFESLGDCPVGEDERDWMEGRLREFIAAMSVARDRRARLTADLLPHPCRLLTHCNISGELVAVAQHCRAMGKDLRVIASETRPYLQGSRLTAWEVAGAGVEVSVIPDCAIAQVISEGAVDAVLVGSDRCAQNGDVVNKVGTYPLALTAREYGIPFYVLVQDPGSLATGQEVTIEERPASELLTFQGHSVTVAGVEGRYPAFDVTPSSLITNLIGFRGVFTPEAFRRRFQKASPASSKRTKEGKRFLLLYGIPQSSGYDDLARVLQTEQADGVLVPEMRPELWGAHVVCPDLAKRNIPATLISDNMMGTLFAQNEIRRLYLSCEPRGEKGAVGICGSLLATLLARAHRVPVELIPSGETRHTPMDHGISTFLGERVTPNGVAAHPIGRDAIPWSLLQGH